MNGTNGYHPAVDEEDTPVASEAPLASEAPPTPPLTPTACAPLNVEQTAKRRRLDCRNYDECLTIAVVQKWESFTCKLCKAYDPKTRLERMREARGLLVIFDPDPE